MALVPSSSHGGGSSSPPGATIAGPVTVTAADLNAPTDSFFAIWTPPANALLLDILIRQTEAWDAAPPLAPFYDGDPASGSAYAGGVFMSGLTTVASTSLNGAGSVMSGVVVGGGGSSIQLPALLGANPAPVTIPTITGLDTPSTTGSMLVWFLYYVPA